MKLRVISWLTLTALYVWGFNTAKSLFIEIIYLTQNGFCLTYLYFSLVAIKSLL
jgi:hypothetical protein